MVVRDTRSTLGVGGAIRTGMRGVGSGSPLLCSSSTPTDNTNRSRPSGCFDRSSSTAPTLAVGSRFGNAAYDVELGPPDDDAAVGAPSRARIGVASTTPSRAGSRSVQSPSFRRDYPTEYLSATPSSALSWAHDAGFTIVVEPVTAPRQGGVPSSSGTDTQCGAAPATVAGHTSSIRSAERRRRAADEP